MRRMGELAVEKFLHRMQHLDHPISHTVFSPQLVIRDTSDLVVEQPVLKEDREEAS
jgi:DNA-binding LacI/PurR family transcriptional regulator